MIDISVRFISALIVINLSFKHFGLLCGLIINLTIYILMESLLSHV